MMIEKPIIPMRPEDVPQQRIHLVESLPSRPSHFDVLIDDIDPMAEDVRPKGTPRNVKYLGTFEWAWSPMNSRICSYYLNPRGRYWLLWSYFYDDGVYDDASGHWYLSAYGFKKGVSADQAAVYLLMEAWRAEADDTSLDHYHWIAHLGELTVGTIKKIADIAWQGESE